MVISDGVIIENVYFLVLYIYYIYIYIYYNIYTYSVFYNVQVLFLQSEKAKNFKKVNFIGKYTYQVRLTSSFFCFCVSDSSDHKYVYVSFMVIFTLARNT